MIFFVVYWHVSINTGTTDSPINTMFLPFFLTLFFFISGYFSNIKSDLSAGEVCRKITKRTKTLLIPTVVMCTLYALYSGMSTDKVLFNDMKGGYWFTFVAFEIYLFYIAVEYILRKLSSDGLKLWMYLGIIALFSYLTLIGHRWDSSATFRLFSTYQVIKYIPFFFLGSLSRQYQTIFFTFLRNDILAMIGIAVMIGLYVFHSRASVCIQGYLGIYLIFAAFLKFEDVFNKRNGYMRFISTVGKSTLTIYFLHYFLLGGISVLSEPFQYIMSCNGWVVNAMLTSATAIVLIVICIAIGKIITVSPSLHRLCFGTKTI